jgi:hypothetical protein
MQLFRVTTSIYGGSDVVIGASWDLLPWFVAAGAAVIIVHAVVKLRRGTSIDRRAEMTRPKRPRRRPRRRGRSTPSARRPHPITG